MKEMKYEEDRKMELLGSDEYHGYRYLVLSLGTHPTAYIEIPKGNRLWEKDYDDIDIDVHGGLTYARHQLMGIDGENWYIGWDYAHAGDYYGGNIITRSTDKKWTTEEIEDECKDAINQIIDKYCQEKDIDIPLIPDDELWKFDGKPFTASSMRHPLDYNFKVLHEKINQVIEEFNEFRKEDK